MTTSDRHEPTPRFAALYGNQGFVSPRMAYRLWTAAQFCGDTWRFEEEDPRVTLMYLPPISHRWAVGVP